MLNIWIYFLLLLLLLIYHITKKTNTVGLILVFLYCLIGAVSIIAKSNGFITRPAGILPLIFLVISYLIFFRPFLCDKTRFTSKKIDVEIDQKFLIFLYLYIFCSLIFLIDIYPKVIELIISGNWRLNYDSQIVAEGVVTFDYSNRIIWLAAQISGYTADLAVLIGVLLLRNRQHFKLASITLLLTALSRFATSIYASSRGSLFIFGIYVIALVLFVFPEINKNVKRILILCAAVVVFYAVQYVIAVTVSRFSSIGVSESLITYFGQPPIIFSDGVATIDKLSWGKYTIGGLFGTPFSQATVGGSWGTGYYTFVGWLYIDWGPIGTLLIGMICSRILTRIVNKTKYTVRDLFIVFYYLHFLIMGSLVIGRGQMLNIVMAIVLYFLLGIYDKIKFVTRGNSMN